MFQLGPNLVLDSVSKGTTRAPTQPMCFAQWGTRGSVEWDTHGPVGWTRRVGQIPSRVSLVEPALGQHLDTRCQQGSHPARCPFGLPAGRRPRPPFHNAIGDNRNNKSNHGQDECSGSDGFHPLHDRIPHFHSFFVSRKRGFQWGRKKKTMIMHWKEGKEKIHVYENKSRGKRENTA